MNFKRKLNKENIVFILNFKFYFLKNFIFFFCKVLEKENKSISYGFNKNNFKKKNIFLKKRYLNFLLIITELKIKN